MSAFQTLFILAVAYGIVGATMRIAVTAGTGTTTTTDPDTGEKIDHTKTPEPWAYGLDVAQTMIGTAYAVFFFIVATLTRFYVRRKYSIPEGCCGPCDDICCSFWCGTCSVCQMARHTADYANHPAACCTETGLWHGAPDVV
jgi:Cys-rich protein (TIGR01571 family)